MDVVSKNADHQAIFGFLGKSSLVSLYSKYTVAIPKTAENKREINNMAPVCVSK